MRNKKAMSEIVTTVIMVVLALVAVAVIWQIINNLISDKGAQVGITQKCLDVKLNVESVSDCTADGCTIAIKRSAGGDSFTGVKVILKSSTESSKVITIPGNIEELETESLDASITDPLDGFDASTANKVEATVYFTDESGQEQNCPSTTTYNFNAVA
jgi:flagellin-like protein